jgi:hypothetical protein
MGPSDRLDQDESPRCPLEAAAEAASGASPRRRDEGVWGPAECTPGIRLGGVLVRGWWMFGGNWFLIVSAVTIVMSGGWRLTAADLVFWATVPVLLVARWLDIACFGGTSAEGEPGTMSHWRRYGLKLLATTVIVWGASHLLALFFKP